MEALTISTGGFNGPQTVTATVETDDTWFPFDPTSARAITGYNSGGFGATQTGHQLANRSKYCGWGPYNGVTLDGNNDLATNATSGPGYAEMQALAGGLTGLADGNNEDWWGEPCDTPGVWTLRFTVPVATSLAGTTTASSTAVTGLSSTGAIAVGMSVSGTGVTPGTTVTATSTHGVTLSAAATAGGTPTLSFGGNPSVYFNVESQPWSVTSDSRFGPGGTSGMAGNYGGAVIEFPITVNLNQPTFPLYSPAIDLICAPNGNPSIDVIQGLWIGDPRTPSTTPSSQITHPVQMTRVKDNFPGGFFRHMDDLNIAFNQTVNWNDQHAQTSIGYAGNSAAYPRRAAIMAIDPISGADADLAGVAWTNYGLAVAKVTTATAHGLATGNQLNPGVTSGCGFYEFSGSSAGPFPTTTSGTQMDFRESSNAGSVIVTSATTFLVTCYLEYTATHDNVVTSAPPTLASSVALNGSEYVQMSEGQNNIPAGDCIQQDVECGMNSWISVPAMCTDDWCYQLGAYHAANTSPGHLLIAEYANEIWDIRSIIQWMVRARACQTTYEWTSTSGASGRECAAVRQFADPLRRLAPGPGQRPGVGRPDRRSRSALDRRQLHHGGDGLCDGHRGRRHGDHAVRQSVRCDHHRRRIGLHLAADRHGLRR